MGIEVFNRYEKKFMLDLITYKRLQARLEEHLEMDEFNKENGYYTISNIYFDTENHDLIKTSLNKPIYKEKLRLRAYGVPEWETKGYLEIKKKFNGIVNKRRTSMTIDDAATFVATGVPPSLKSYHNEQVINEIKFFTKRYDLVPMIYIAYDRTAYFSKEQRDLRITFDKNIRTRRHDLTLVAGDHGEPLISGDYRLMEIKAERALPLWLTQILSEFKLYPTSFSKYGEEYKNYMNHKKIFKGDLPSCSNLYSQQPQQLPLYL